MHLFPTGASILDEFWQIPKTLTVTFEYNFSCFFMRSVAIFLLYMSINRNMMLISVIIDFLKQMTKFLMRSKWTFRCLNPPRNLLIL